MPQINLSWFEAASWRDFKPPALTECRRLRGWIYRRPLHAKARASARARKLDARRKIILGGALLERARRGGSADGVAAAKLVQDIIEGLSRQNDLKAFEGFEL